MQHGFARVGKGPRSRAIPQSDAVSILPRQGEVAPKATEGEDTQQPLSLTSPSVWQVPATSP
ncbi:hypothetical protein ASF00_02840 [Sphingomonas sp. Leaf34]|nr:hypothetical protein ASF00_02840 [Sphingomonas sp. Leaf34]